MENLHFYIVNMCANGKENPDFELIRPYGTVEFLFIQFKSRGVISLGDATGGNPQVFSPGDCILFEPGFPYSFKPVGMPLCHDWIHFLVSSPEDFRKKGFLFNRLHKPEEGPYLAEMAKIMNPVWLNRTPGHETILNAYMQILTTTYLQSQEVRLLSRYLQERREEFIELRQQLYNRTTPMPTVEELSESVNLSRTRFSQLYTDFFGTSPNKDIQQARLLRAKHLLSATNYALSKIAELCGYGGEFQFIRDFKKHTGLTPGKYRLFRQ